MQINGLKIIPYDDEYKDKIISIWEDSVKATHHFLDPSDIEFYKTIVKDINFNQFIVFCSVIDEIVTGFIGLNENKVEMLFIAPEYFGKGHGKALMHFALNTLNATLVDVNEGNENAINFYKKLGFVVYNRAEKDSEGKDYPILKMRLVNFDA